MFPCLIRHGTQTGERFVEPTLLRCFPFSCVADLINAMKLLSTSSMSGVQTSAGIPSRNARDLETAEEGVAPRDAGVYDCGALCIRVMVDAWVVMLEVFGS